MDVVLIYPPFGAPGIPPYSIASLASYLSLRGIPTQPVDLNNAFYRRYLSPRRLRMVDQFAASRIGQLGTKTQLSFSEMVEYVRLIHLLRASKECRRDMDHLFDPAAAMDRERRAKALNNAINMASLPYFPDIVDIQGQLVKYFSPRNEYSSRDIIAGSKEQDWLYADLAALLDSEPSLENAVLVGLSVCFPHQVLAALKCARILKQQRPNVHVCLGGSFVSCHMRRTRSSRLFEVVDSLVLDDGELPLEQLFHRLSGRGSDLRGIPSLVYPNGTRVDRNSAAPAPDMESLPPPDYHRLALDEYPIPRDQMWLSLRLSRGCAWRRCSFCRTGLPLVKNHQQPTVDFLFRQIEAIVERTGVTTFQFSDDSASPEVLEQLSRRIISRGLPLHWSTSLRFSNRLTVERGMLFKRAGCSHVFLGLESYNDRLLRLMNKGITTRMVDRVLSNLSWAGLPVFLYMIIGFPTETEREALESFQRVEQFRKEGSIAGCLYSPFQIIPFSAVALKPEKYGITRMHVPAQLDLDPPVMDFECRGMERRTAHRLGRHTLSMLGMSLAASGNSESAHTGAAQVPAGPGSGKPETLRWNGTTVRLRPDLDSIRALVESRVNTGLSFSAWLAEGDRALGPAQHDDPPKRTGSCEQ